MKVSIYFGTATLVIFTVAPRMRGHLSDVADLIFHAIAESD